MSALRSSLRLNSNFTAGASYRRYLGKRGWAIEPEYSLMAVSSHTDNMLIMNGVKDLTKPTRQYVLYTIMGGGLNYNNLRGDFRVGPGGIGWGMGLEGMGW